MNREQYISALVSCYKMETAGAIAGEVAMLLREDPLEKHKLGVFRRLEASNKILCREALQQEDIALPRVETSYYHFGFELGQRFGEGEWGAFLDRFEATVHPEIFAAYLLDDEGNEIAHEYDGVNLELLRHLHRHELALADFVAAERQGNSQNSTLSMESVLDCELCTGLVGAEDPVGW